MILGHDAQFFVAHGKNVLLGWAAHLQNVLVRVCLWQGETESNDEYFEATRCILTLQICQLSTRSVSLLISAGHIPKWSPMFFVLSNALFFGWVTFCSLVPSNLLSSLWCSIFFVTYPVLFQNFELGPSTKPQISKHDRRKFRSQTSDNMDRWKAELGRGREKRRVEESRSEKRKRQKKEDADARKGRKVAKHCGFSMICGSGGSKSRLAKAAGAEPSGQMRDEKVHAIVARSTFVSEKTKSTSRSDHFWKLRCRKSARRCGAKHISKSKCTKHTMFGPLLLVEMSKKGTPLWREAQFEVKMHKTKHTFRSRFAWQAQGIVYLLKSEQNVRVL